MSCGDEAKCNSPRRQMRTGIANAPDIGTRLMTAPSSGYCLAMPGKTNLLQSARGSHDLDARAAKFTGEQRTRFAVLVRALPATA